MFPFPHSLMKREIRADGDYTMTPEGILVQLQVFCHLHREIKNKHGKKEMIELTPLTVYPFRRKFRLLTFYGAGDP